VRGVPLSGRVVDLTQPLGPGAVLWPGSEPIAVQTVSSIEADGAFARRIDTPEHAGTHLDAPAHFVADGMTTDRIPPERLVVEGALLDVAERCAENPGFILEATDLEELERRDGEIAEGSAVLLRTGWEAHLGDPGRYLGGSAEEDLHFPGFAESAARLLIDRGAIGIGTDTVSVDAGNATEFPVHQTTLPTGLWHLEGLVNLAELPPRGFTLFVGALPLVGGSGTPARVLALVQD
jgi:kynurenine formamidase